MGNISSDKISVFPSSQRGAQGDNYVAARVFSEANIINITNQLLGKESFVITDTYSAGSSFSFNIAGYYFNISTGSDIIDAAGTDAADVYAVIELTDKGYIEIKGADMDSLYEGLTIQKTEPEDLTNKKCLHLLHKNNNTWVIPDEAKIRFVNQHIDGGIID